MQKHDASLFNSWLARDFISRGEHEFRQEKNTYGIVLTQHGASQMFDMKIWYYSFLVKPPS